MKSESLMATNVISKGRLARVLSRLDGFSEGKVKFEQYITDSEIAADILWKAYSLGDIYGKSIADLGCGTGVLGIGTILLGAKRVFFIDIDKTALEIAKSNYSKVKSESLKINIEPESEVTFVEGEINSFKTKVDTIIQNPPFGTKVRHNDRIFLENAIEVADIVYSLHKSETLDYLKGFISKKGKTITHIWNYKLPLKQTYSFHTKRIERIDVSCIRIK